MYAIWWCALLGLVNQLVSLSGQRDLQHIPFLSSPLQTHCTLQQMASVTSPCKHKHLGLHLLIRQPINLFSVRTTWEWSKYSKVMFILLCSPPTSLPKVTFMLPVDLRPHSHYMCKAPSHSSPYQCSLIAIKSPPNSCHAHSLFLLTALKCPFAVMRMKIPQLRHNHMPQHLKLHYHGGQLHHGILAWMN